MKNEENKMNRGTDVHGERGEKMIRTKIVNSIAEVDLDLSLIHISVSLWTLYGVIPFASRSFSNLSYILYLQIHRKYFILGVDYEIKP